METSVSPCHGDDETGGGGIIGVPGRHLLPAGSKRLILGAAAQVEI